MTGMGTAIRRVLVGRDRALSRRLQFYALALVAISGVAFVGYALYVEHAAAIRRQLGFVPTVFSDPAVRGLFARWFIASVSLLSAAVAAFVNDGLVVSLLVAAAPPAGILVGNEALAFIGLEPIPLSIVSPPALVGIGVLAFLVGVVARVGAIRLDRRKR